ncbi:hypothetical protein F5888DRAFT_944332 [Russula emetica]|nr:hypothetical protein F5888DRAFT_944332 [Russula emetica]
MISFVHSMNRMGDAQMLVWLCLVQLGDSQENEGLTVTIPGISEGWSDRMYRAYPQTRMQCRNLDDHRSTLMLEDDVLGESQQREMPNSQPWDTNSYDDCRTRAALPIF